MTEEVKVRQKPGPKPKRPTAENRTSRPRRSAVGGAGSGGRLKFDNLDPDYHYYLVTDIGTKVEEFKSYGYEVDRDPNVIVSSVNPTQTGSGHSIVVDKRTGEKGVLMRQPKEYHEEDRELRAKAIAKTEESMFRKLKTDEGRYGEVEQSNNLARAVED